MGKALWMGIVAGAALAGSAWAQEAAWPGWRGPARNGVAAVSPALVDAFPETGPVKAWTSDTIIGDKAGGFGSVAVAGGKAYVLSNRSFREETPERRIARQRLVEQGYVADMPAEFSKLVEAARMDPERLKINDKQKAISWGEEWLKGVMKDEWQGYRQAALDRIAGGKYAPPLDVLAKLETVKERVFASQAELDAWYKEAGISEADGKLLDSRQVITKTIPKGEDTLYCLDAATGKTLWTRVQPGVYLDWPASTTPTVVGDKVYFLGSAGTVTCLATADGKPLWESEGLETGDNGRSRCSSVLVVDGMAVVCTQKNLAALDAETGKVAWRQKKIGSQSGSASTWAANGKTMVICAGSGKMTCVDLKTGTPAWTTTCASETTPAIVGEYMAYVGGNDKIGLRAYKLGADKAEQLWNVPLKDIYTSPVIYEGYVYAVGEKGRALCVELATGKVAWEGKITPGEAEMSSPVVADGKLIVVATPWLYIIKATPEKFTVLTSANVGALKYTSPAIVDGRVYIRTPNAVVCYDLRKQ